MGFERSDVVEFLVGTFPDFGLCIELENERGIVILTASY